MDRVFLALLLFAPSKRDTNITINAYWDAPPIVVLCDDAPITMHRLSMAIEWTRERGARWSNVYRGECFPDPPYNVIQVERMPEWMLPCSTHHAGDCNAGMTMLLVYHPPKGVPVAVRGKLFLDDGAGSRLVTVPEHELVHAAGLDHVSGTVGHMMADTIRTGGWRDEGIADALGEAWARLD